MSDRSVCSLSDEQLEERRAMVRAEILPHVRKVERIEGGFAIETDATPELREKLQDFVALERRCCSSVHWDLSEVPHSGRVRLDVRGLDPDAALLRWREQRPGSRCEPSSTSRSTRAGAS
jgi:hypothetical protein